MKKLKVYLDTSVVSYLRDRPMHRGKAESAFGLYETDKVSCNRNG